MAVPAVPPAQSGAAGASHHFWTTATARASGNLQQPDTYRNAVPPEASDCHKTLLIICKTVVVRPDIIVENAFGTHLFSAETDQGRRWLAERTVAGKCECLGKFVSVDDARDARDLVDAAVADGLDVME